MSEHHDEGYGVDLLVTKLLYALHDLIALHNMLEGELSHEPGVKDIEVTWPSYTSLRSGSVKATCTIKGQELTIRAVVDLQRAEVVDQSTGRRSTARNRTPEDPSA